MKQAKAMKNSIKLDNFTLKVLQNFSSINNGVVVNSGSEIRTMTEGKTVLAEAIVPDIFPVDFAIYDLRQLLSFVSSLFDNPDMSFEDNCIKVSDGNDVTKIFYCNPELISTPSKRINMPSEDIKFDLSEDTLKKIQKASSILGVDDISFSSAEDKVLITVLDKTNPSCNTWSTSTSAELFDESLKFNVFLKISNLKMMEGDYQVTISTKGISRFKSMRSDLKYFIATEADSSIK